MWTKVFLLLIGAVCIYQVSSQDIYVAELMVESNITLEAQTILLSWSAAVSFDVEDSNNQVHQVTISSSELVAECLVVGEDYSCNCSKGYYWSNEVCYTYSCCNESTCTKNVSLATSICVLPTPVHINGSIPTTLAATAAKTVLEKHLGSLNGLKFLNVTVLSSIADFEVEVNVKLNTSALQEKLDNVRTEIGSGIIFADTQGMVTITVPNSTVNYKSQHLLNCTYEEEGVTAGSAGWNLSREFERFEINNGLSAEIIHISPDYQNYVAVNLTKLTGAWIGTYECGFTIGSVRHIAKSYLDVALLPDEINMKFDPLVADCSNNLNPTVTVSASIPKTKELYDITWFYDKTEKFQQKTKNDTFVYNYDATIDCNSGEKTHNVTILFKNRKSQNKSAQVDIPVLKAGDLFCEENVLNGDNWPKTPTDSTVIIKTCPVGRIGQKTRVCDPSNKWEDVFSECINEELDKVANAADNFLNGLGATQEVAKNIFEGIKNSSNLNSASNDETADISASIGIIGIMANASKNIVLKEDVFPDLIEGASNMVSSNWSSVNDTIRHKMSEQYLLNMENLVKNIEVNTSEGFNSTNLELKFCSRDDCNMTVFGVEVAMNRTSGLMKTMGVKNLMEKLKTDPDKNHNSILMSATLTNNNDSNITIQMMFPNEQLNATEFLCVFWDTKNGNWSDQGCIANTTDNNQTFCECNHLTSFSVLMSKTNNVSSPTLDLITYIGLGVSIFSLLVFLLIEYLVWSVVTKTNLSHFRHTAIVNIAIFRLLADCSFLASAFPDKLSDTLCFAFTVCKHLFYLAMFTWMLCLSVMLVHQLIFVFSPVRKRVFMFLSSIVGYVVPIVLVGTSYVYYKYTNAEYYSRKTCWLTYQRLLEGSIHAFILPMGIITLANLFSMVVVIVTLVKTSVPDSSKADDKETAKSILKVVVFLTPVFGVTWIIGFFLYTMDEGTIMFEVVNYTFTILNSFQVNIAVFTINWKLVSLMHR
uniref:Adhesion G-protein coupled receptor F3-like n=1 Tax=Kryptolebias marmoratus TaxID=37003 RepID=A0A3Q3GR92_KRYMA